MTGQSKLVVMISDEDIVDKRYENGKIYTIKHPQDDKVYVGSTINSLNDRFNGHKRDKTCSLFKYVDGNFDGWYIELYEDFPCKNKYELRKKEGHIIKQIGTINKYIAGRNAKEWCEDNKYTVLKRCKKYRKDNKDNIAERKKIYYESNKDKILEKHKQWYENNKYKLSEQRKQKVICDRCGFEGRKDCLQEHKRSFKCINFKPS